MPQTRVSGRKLRDEHPDLDKKLSSRWGMTLPALMGLGEKTNLTEDDIKRGLNSDDDIAREFFARCLVRSQPFTALRESLGNEGIQDRIVELAQDGDAFAESLLNVMEDTLLPEERFKKLIASHPDLFKRIIGTPGGNNAAYRMFWDGRFGISGVGSSLTNELVFDMLEAQVRGQELQDRDSTRILWPLARPVETDHLDSMSNKDIRNLFSTYVLEGNNRTKAFEVIAEFFSSQEKFERFMNFTRHREVRKLLKGTIRNSDLLMETMLDDPEYTVLALFDVLKTDGGIRRLAEAFVERSDVFGGGWIQDIGDDPKGVEIMRGVYLAPAVTEEGRGAGLEMIYHALDMSRGDEKKVAKIANGIRGISHGVTLRRRYELEDVPISADMLEELARAGRRPST